MKCNNVHLLRTNLNSLGLDSIPILLLTNVSEEADNLIALLCTMR